jgi:excisionase family DNA binding protein
VADFGKPRFPSEIDVNAMVGPSSFSSAFDKSLLHFCCTDSEQRRSPFSRMGMRNSSIRFRPRGELPIAPPALFSVRDVARRLRVSTATVYRLCERGELHHVRVSNAIRIAPRDLELLLRRKRRARDSRAGQRKNNLAEREAFSTQLIQRLDFLLTIGSGDYGVGIEKNLSIGELTPAGSSCARQIRAERLDRVDLAAPRSQLFL